MDDSQKSSLNGQIKTEEATTAEDNPVFQALAKVLENQESVCTCQLMSELYSLTEKEQPADDSEREP